MPTHKAIAKIAAARSTEDVFHKVPWDTKTRVMASGLKSTMEDFLFIVSLVVMTLEGVRLNIDYHHAKWFKIATDVAESVGVNPSLPRMTATMKHRSNVPGEDEEVYCRRNNTVPVLGEVK